ncbi:hypothetical protein P8452_76206 [Trifolium repens]|nr:hypothetical protein P8452_76206 [Trifolium repens]
MDSTCLTSYSKSLFDETHASMVACQVYDILREPVDWNMDHHVSNYLDMVKVNYRTFHIEYPRYEVL